MEGFLKLKQTFWNKYYFILTNDCLVFCDRKGEPIKGRFHLKVSNIKSIESKPLWIVINNGFSDVYLETENVAEKIKWINALSNKQDELRKNEDQEIYNLHNLDEILMKDQQVSEEVKENLENKFVNSLAELWNLQANIDENLDNLSNAIKDTFLMNILKKVENSVSIIKVKINKKVFFINFTEENHH